MHPLSFISTVLARGTTPTHKIIGTASKVWPAKDVSFRVQDFTRCDEDFWRIFVVVAWNLGCRHVSDLWATILAC